MIVRRCSCAADVHAPAKKSLGQNFLTDPQYQLRIVEALEAGADDHVVEIGPGRGALTRHLIGRTDRLTLIELDHALARDWQREAERDGRIDVRHADALAIDFATLADTGRTLRVIGNIPYNITSPLIFHLLDTARTAACIVLMVQREVADRILAEPGSRTYGALSIGVRSVAAVERLFHVPRGAFRPVPNVDSTVVRVVPAAAAALSADEERDLRTLTRTAFSWRRKQLRKILRDAEAYHLAADDIARVADAGFDLDARPEALSPDEFIRLARLLRQLSS